MRLCLLDSITLALLLCAQLTYAAGLVPFGTQHPNNIISPRQVENLSPCLTQCFLKVFPQFHCPNVTTCICTNKPLQAALATCAIGSNCAIEDLLAGKKAQASLCGEPVRNRSMTFFITATILFVLATACATTRVAIRSRSFGGAGYWWDDWALFICCGPMLGLTVIGYMEVHYGLGRDTWDLSIDNIERCIMLFYIGNTFYAPVVFGTKMSFVLLYLRIWTDGVIFRPVCYVVLALLAVALIGFEFSTIFLCTPIDYTWKAIRGATGHCIDRQPQLYTSSSTNIALDILVLLLPIPKILALRKDLQRRVGLNFMVGFAATSASSTQLYYLVTKLADTQNPTWDFFDIGLWRIVEMYLSIICCCMPMMAGLGVRSWKRLATRSRLPSPVHRRLDDRLASSSDSKSKTETTGTARSGGSLNAGTAGLKDDRWQQLPAREKELGVVDTKRPITAQLGPSKGFWQTADMKCESAAAKIQESAMLDNDFAERDFAQRQHPIMKPVMVRSGSDNSESWSRETHNRASRLPTLRNLRTTITSLSPPLSPTDEEPPEMRRNNDSARLCYPPPSDTSSDDEDTLPNSPRYHAPALSEAEASRKRWSPLNSSMERSSTIRQMRHPLRSNGMSGIFEEEDLRPPPERQSTYERRALPSVPPKA